MILGTHNTMTYKKPTVWFHRPFKFIGKCQSVDYKTQHEKYGVNAIDLRIFWDENGNIEFRHGGFSYDASDLYDILDYCDKERMIVRVFFEERNKKLKERSEKLGLKEKFIELCTNIEWDYPNITFYGGRNVGTWEVIYDFGNQIEEIGLYSSVTSLFDNNPKGFWGKLDNWFPYLYALLKNKKNKKLNNELYADKDVIVQYDFIQIG